MQRIHDPMASRWSGIFVLATGYAALAWLGLALAGPTASVSPFWPAAGLAVGLLWRFGLRLLPGLFIGAFLTSLLLVHAGVDAAAFIACGTCLGLGGSAWILRRLQANPRLQRPSDPLLVLLASVVGSGISGMVGAACLVPAPAFLATLQTWWAGDLAGIMATIGVVSTAHWDPPAALRQRREALSVALLAVAALTLCLILPEYGQGGLSPWAFTLFPPLLYAAVRLGPMGTSITVCAIALAAAALTAAGVGPFTGPVGGNRIHFPFQFFIIAASGTTLVLAAHARSQVLAQTALRTSEQRLAEAQRSATLSERMASIGTLAGGVAHEFNNLNAVVMGNVELALCRPDLPPDARRRLEQIRDAVDREKGIVEALLAFSRSDRSPSEVVEVGHVVSTTMALARRTLRQRRITLHVEPSGQPIFALIPAGSLGQVLLNLLLNACDAVDRRHDPQVWIGVQRDGQFVRLTVRDNGIGIDPAIMPHIFTPFYSTKGEHALADQGQPWLRGTGLGLSVCQTLIGQMGGSIAVDSRPEQGATFTVSIPLVDAPRPTVAAAPGTTPCARVLVVDDEPEIRRLLCEHLTAAGHVAVEAKDGQQALDHLGQEDIDVIMLNWCMPGIDGQGVLEHIELHPERSWPPVIVVSGWTGGGSGIDHWRREIACQLRKPFSLEQVRSSIERALCGQRGA